MYEAERGLIADARVDGINPTVALALNELLWIQTDFSDFCANADYLCLALRRVLSLRSARRFLESLRTTIDDACDEIDIEPDEPARLNNGITQYLIDSATQPCYSAYDLSWLKEDFELPERNAMSVAFAGPATAADVMQRCYELILRLPFDATGFTADAAEAGWLEFALMFLRRPSMAEVFVILANPWNGWTRRNKLVMRKFLAAGAQLVIWEHGRADAIGQDPYQQQPDHPMRTPRSSR